MKTIQPFINLGWHTVPLKGELKRLEDGSKTLPQFEKEWRKKYQEQQNEKATKIGGAITGAVSNIIAIDCDNDLTYSLFSSLDPEYKFRFVSKGKKKNAGTLVYEYDEEFADSFSINDGTVALDFYSNNGFVYLPTEANETKEAWNGKVPKLAKLPDTVKLLLKQMQVKPVKQAEVAPASTNTLTAACLQPLVQQFVDKRKFMPGLFKIITPRAFRDLDQYISEGYLHPKNVPPGRGSEYLSKVSAILGADISIDEELYIQALHDINDLWDDPMDSERLDATIAEPMLNGNSSIDGVPIWKYEADWSTYRLILGTKRQSSLDIGYDDLRLLYYCVDLSNETFRSFASDGELMGHINSVALQPPKKAEVLRAIPMINVESSPNKEFGYTAGNDPTARTLNTFVQTPELKIISDPGSYEAMYRKPEATLSYLKTLVPNEKMYNYLLGFIRHKLLTFEYSPVILYFMGVQGSGKDTFVQILEKIMGNMARPSTKEFLEQYNGWMLDTYFVQLDEYGNQLTTMRDKEEALGKLKAFTGKSKVQLRKMRTDGFSYEHSITFIMTANKNPLMLEDGDRRIAFFATPTTLVSAFDDVPELHRKIMAETKDFAYYLATQVKPLSRKEYMTPPASDDKHELVADSMHAAAKIAYAFKHKMYDYIKNLALEYDTTIDLSGDRVHTVDLDDLYQTMTEYKGDMRSLVKTLRSSGIPLHRSSKQGEHSYYFEIEDIF